MHLEEELLAHLDEVIKSGETKARDVGLISFFHGFGDEAWPTLEEAGEKFGGLTRERARQIIKARFRDTTGKRDLPELWKCAKLVASSRFWVASELLAAIASEGWAPQDAHLRGILNLMQDLGLCDTYNLYDGRIQPLSRATANGVADCLVLSADAVQPLRKAVLEARRIPGKTGLADIEFVPGSREIRERVLAALRLDPDAWIGTVNARTWYAYEDRENPLVNASAKVFGIADRVEVGRLATCLANYLRGRSNKHGKPGETEIERFLRGSRLFSCDAVHARFEGEITDLNQIDRDVVEYLQLHPDSPYVEIASDLAVRGYGKPIIDKAVVTSVLVHVDRSEGRGHHTYSLVTRGKAAKARKVPADARYAAFARRLQRIKGVGTDASVEATARREQSILSEWLFSDRRTMPCAICGVEYGTDSLVTAHKKRRSLCNERERLDPYVVMPLCLFGCDHLYERRLVSIAGGRVQGHPDLAAGEGERLAITRLDGRRLLAEWSRGNPSYFE